MNENHYYPAPNFNNDNGTRSQTTQKEAPVISVSEPYPLLDPGTYTARCTEASYAWSRQWKKWIALLVLEPVNYCGRPYTGRLCKFLGLGKNPQKPYAGPQTHFRRLLVEVNGGQPTRPDVDMKLFVGVLYDIEVENVTTNREGKKRSSEHWYSVAREIHLSEDKSIGTDQPSNLKPFNSSTLRTPATHSTDQHSNTENTPLAKQQKQVRCKKTSLGGAHVDQQHTDPDEGAAANVVQPPRANRKRRITLRIE